MLTAPPEAALSTLRGTEKHLSRDPVKAEAYRAEIMKLEKTGYATRVSPEKARTSKESWFIPHHLVTHNGKNRVVFNCSFTYKDQNLNELLLSAQTSSFSSPDGAKEVIDKLRGLLMEGGFELRQWASNIPDVISHLPKEISVGYLRTEDAAGHVEVAFLTARSRVAPKRQLDSAVAVCSLTGAQLANLLIRELTLEVSRVVMWTDSTTVLAWIQSDSCRFKVFVGTRIAEIQELTDSQAWRYVETSENPADDLTRGRHCRISGENRWTQGPPFLWLPPDQWPTHPIAEGEDVAEELRRPTTCLMATVTTNHPLPDAQQFSSFSELVDSDLKHPGAERLFAELRRKFWILRGREAIRREQRSCPECQRWRAQPVNPKMADLPPARLRLYRHRFSQRD
ncbi:hypothetical protein AAFF_G00187850 [Aldrovandia affinis]|uniref:Integrase zinc-binding domain-containing protein n=1 Tax=Aldrovandia affinis TaxID=143900 RepID=A0AAD7SY52_9TELE|nr:hypothetical protein AAFF_G00187850 [Aldrovandia affinis]